MADTEVDEQSFGRPVEQVLRSRNDRGQKYEASRKYLDRLYRGNADDIQGAPPDAGQVNEAFTHLEAYLGEAGRRCIEQYHEWGNNFWQTEEPKLLNGILKAYWHQVNIVASMRKKFMDRYEPMLLIPITPEMLTDFDGAIADLSQEGGPFDGIPEMEREQYVNLFRIEVGHLRSINQKIARNLNMQCSDDLVQCQSEPGNKNAVTWAELVNTVLGKWKRKDTIREDVLGHFETFLLSPELNNWNRMIASLVLWKYQVDFVKQHKDILANLKGARQFMALAVKHVQTELKTADFTDEQEGYPDGYLGLIRLFSERDTKINMLQDLQAVNFLVSDNAGDRKRDTIELLVDLDASLDALVGQGEDVRDEALILAGELSSEVEDSAIQRELDRPTKKKKGKRSARVGSEEEPPRRRQVLDFGFSKEADPEIRDVTEDKLMSDMREIARYIRVIRADESTEDQRRGATNNLYQKITGDKFLKEFLNTLCKVGYADQPAEAQEAVEESFSDLDPGSRRSGARPMQGVEFSFLSSPAPTPSMSPRSPPQKRQTTRNE
uniref:Uncharacterized protein n=1 Tax=viral metagenome TaxID=1070528 RepID=A0A6C0BLH9_9ZZZZ